MRGGQASRVCSICGGPRFTATPWGRYLLLRCRGCGLVVRWPPADPSEEVRYYREAYYRAPNIAAWDVRRLGLYAGPLLWLEARVHGRRLLDVGCGYGHFLTLARDRGWEATGLEPSIQAAAVVRSIPGVRTVEGTIGDLAGSPERFDCITAWNVLELMANPRRDLEVLVELLSPGGWLLLRVLNGSVHYAAWRWGSALSRWGGFSPPAMFHNYGFSARALQNLLQAVGLREVSVRNSPLAGHLPGHIGGTRALLLMTAVRAMAAGAALLSGGRLRLGPNLLAFARRP